MAAKIISFVNQKGGVGKTTTAVNLAAYLAVHGQRILLVDLDPQANATSGLGIERPQTGVYQVLSGQIGLESAIQSTEQDNLFVLAATSDLAGASVELSEQPNKLKSVLAKLDQFDMVLIDAPPSLGALTINALTASHAIIIPLQAEYYALEGIAGMLDTVERIKQSLNPKLETLGIVVTMFDTRTNLAQQVEQNVRQHFGDAVFWSVIPRNVKLSEAPSYGQTINKYAPISSGAGAYKRLAQEVMQRVQKL
ncbi:MAG: ParA family protein [Deinococcales bacterium]